MKPLTLFCLCEAFLMISSVTRADSFCTNVQAGAWRSASCNLEIRPYNPTWTGILILYSNGFTAFVNDDDPGPGWNPTMPVIPRGRGAFIRPYEATRACFDGAIAPPSLPLNLPDLSLVSCQSNVVATFEGIVGRAPVEGTKVYRFNPGSGRDPLNVGQAPDYSTYTYSDGQWSPVEPVVGVGEAVWVDQPNAFVYQPRPLNPRHVSGQLTFELETVYGKSVTVQFADSLPASSWQELLTFTGDGYRTTVIDSHSRIVVQRFYRIQTASP